MSWKRILARSSALEASERSIAASIVSKEARSGAWRWEKSDCKHGVQLVSVPSERLRR
jgi:hypothetical protein